MRPWKAFDFELSTPDRFTPMSTHSSISPLGFWSPVARHRSLPSWPRVTGRRSRAAGRCISPLECTLTKNRACKSFTMCTYKSLDLKSPGMNTYKKYRGGRGVCLLQMQDLTRTCLQTPAFLSLSC